MAKCIMVVDDSASIRQVERTILAGAGYQVVEASNGNDALAKLGQQPVHLILTDLNMPGLDGVKLIQSVRRDPGHRHTPVIMVTTESQESKKQEGRAAGATGWMVKPFTPEQLVAVVRKVVG